MSRAIVSIPAFVLFASTGLPAGAQVSPTLATPVPATCAQPTVAARVLQAARPDLPQRAVHYGVGGRVVVMVSLAADSHVAYSRIESSSSRFLDASALAAARASRYAGAIRDCKPVPGVYAFIVDYDLPSRLPPVRVDAAKFFPGTWSCTAEASGETRSLVFLRDGDGFDMNDGATTITLVPDEYRLWRIRRNGEMVGWAFPWVDEIWEWGTHGANDHAVRIRHVDDATFSLTTSVGTVLATIEKNERCARLASPAAGRS